MPAAEERGVLTDGGEGRQLRVHRLDRPEEEVGLVDEVRVEVEQQPAALLRRRVLPPPLLRHRTPSFPAQLGPDHLADQAVRHDLGQRAELRVVPAVLEHRQRDASPDGGVDRLQRRRRVDPERLVDDDRQTGGHDLCGLCDVDPTRRREYDEVDPVRREQGGEVRDHDGAG